MTETKKYWLTCSCDKKYKVGIHQAGNEISCDCGRSLAVPSLIKLKKLPPAFVEVDLPVVVSRSEQSRKVLWGSGCAVLLVGLSVIVFGFTKRPTLEAALTQQTEYSYQGEWVYQDFAPLTEEEYVLSLLTAEDIEGIAPAPSWSLWLALEKGPEPSSSLTDRIRILRIQYYAWLGIGAAISMIGLITLVSAVIGKMIQDKAQASVRTREKSQGPGGRA
jgi:hypothetical protein